jgi:dUTP pyrophosphatase
MNNMKQEIQNILDILYKNQMRQLSILEDIKDNIVINSKLLTEQYVKDMIQVKEELQALIKTDNPNQTKIEMGKVLIKVETSLGATIPLYATSGSVGCDLCANIKNTTKEQFKGEGFRVIAQNKVVLSPGGRIAIPTGLKLEIPEGYELQIRGRSGLAVKNGIGIVNGIGTIDSDYRGEIHVILINLDQICEFTISHGDRIAQGVLNKINIIEFEEVDLVNETERGNNGFGSTGIK